MGVAAEVLKRILDKVSPDPDFATDAHERRFRHCFNFNAEARTENRTMYIRPKDMAAFKKKLCANGLENCGRSNQIIAWLEGDKSRWLEVRHG